MIRKLMVIAGLAIVAAPLVAADMTAAEKEIQAQAQGFAAAWDKHDTKAMAGFFAEKSTLINPFGRLAAGRAEVEKLFADEHSTVMAGTTYEVKLARVDWVTPEVAVVLWNGSIVGMKSQDGKPMPPFAHQVTVVDHKVGGKWEVVAGRPVAYPPAPTPVLGPATK